MIEAEQAFEPLGILFVAFQVVDERELLVHQRSAAPRQRLEHVVDLHLQVGLLAGEEHGLFVQFVDGVRDLADFLGGVHRQRLHRAHLASGPHPLQFAREVAVSNLEGTVAEPPQRADERARHQRDDEERERGWRRRRSRSRGWPQSA